MPLGIEVSEKSRIETAVGFSKRGDASCWNERRASKEKNPKRRSGARELFAMRGNQEKELQQRKRTEEQNPNNAEPGKGILPNQQI